MNFDPQIHHRRSIRLKGYDYTLSGAYFITLVTWQREELFGNIVNAEMCLSEYGKIALEEWLKTAEIRLNICINRDEFVVMPNHIHGIIWIKAKEVKKACEQFGKPVQGSIPTIIRAYKSAVTYRANALRDSRGNPIWQRNYYEHIIRDEPDFYRIWNYIDHNPQRWKEDQLHSFPPGEEII
jgi:putative transposase